MNIKKIIEKDEMTMSSNIITRIVRCRHECDKKTRCFVCKVRDDIPLEGVVLHKCPLTKQDVIVNLSNKAS